MKENFYPENFNDPVSGDSNILIVKPSKNYDATNDLKKLVLDKREVVFTYPKEGIDLFQETIASECKVVLQIGQPCTRKLPFFDGTLTPELEKKIWENVKDKYVNYHHHDEYSLRDALGTSKQLAALLKAQGRKFMSITNHGSIGGWIKQNNSCKENGIKPIFGCLLPNMPIIYKDGIKPINKISIGDHVLTHKGKFEKVNSVFSRKYDGYIYNLKCWGSDGLWVTGEHPILVLKNESFGEKGHKWDYNIGWQKAENINPMIKYGLSEKNKKEKPQNIVINGNWSHYAVVPKTSFKTDKKIDLSEILGDYCILCTDGLLMKLPKTKNYNPYSLGIPKTIEMDDEWMRFFGLYISEGSHSHGVVRFSLNMESDKDAIIFLKDFCDRKFNLKLSQSGEKRLYKGRLVKACDFYICNVMLSKIMPKLFGRGAKNKKFPISWLGLEKHLLNSLLKGIWEGDGSKKGNVLRTSSNELAHLCRLAIVNVDGNCYKISKTVQRGKFIAYDIKRGLSTRNSQYTFGDNNYVYLPIRSIDKKYYSGMVYNFEVQNDNSYVSEIAVHNCEAYQNNYRGDDPLEKSNNRKAYHLILLAQTIEGFYNIIKIHNDAQLHGFYYSPRTCDEALKKYGKGVIATSACLAGWIPKLLLADKEDEAIERYNFYKSCFDEFYIEIQLIEMEEQKALNRKLIQFAQKVGAPLTIGIDSHYLYPENEETHSLLMCIRQKRTVNDLEKPDDDTWQFTVKNLYYRDYEQLHDLFKDGFINAEGKLSTPFEDDVFTEEVFYRACQNTRKITVCADDIKMDTGIKLPKLYEDSEEIFRKRVWEGFNEKGFDKIPETQVYRDRLSYELDVICLSGWSDYFLITKMIVDKARELKGDFGVGFGRGSACGSLASYCINVTGIDPIKYDLLFERFLDFSRSEINVCTFEV